MNRAQTHGKLYWLSKEGEFLVADTHEAAAAQHLSDMGEPSSSLSRSAFAREANAYPNTDKLASLGWFNLVRLRQ